MLEGSSNNKVKACPFIRPHISPCDELVQVVCVPLQPGERESTIGVSYFHKISLTVAGFLEHGQVSEYTVLPDFCL